MTGLSPLTCSTFSACPQGGWDSGVLWLLLLSWEAGWALTLPASHDSFQVMSRQVLQCQLDLQGCHLIYILVTGKAQSFLVLKAWVPPYPEPLVPSGPACCVA